MAVVPSTHKDDLLDAASERGSLKISSLQDTTLESSALETRPLSVVVSIGSAVVL